MGVADGHRQGIGGILLGNFGEIEQPFGHLLNLLFVGAAVANNRIFDLQGRVFRDLHVGIDAGEQRDSASMAKLKRRSRVTGHENLFNGNRLWSVTVNQFTQLHIDAAQTFCQGILATGYNNAIVEMLKTVAPLFDKAVAGRLATGINAENSHN